MWYIGIDLHKHSLTLLVMNYEGEIVFTGRFATTEEDAWMSVFLRYQPFTAVIEASGTFRWLYDLLNPYGSVVVAHPLRLRAIWSGRAKTDALDAKVLADLLRANLIPTSYVPPENYQMLRELTRARARIVRDRTHARNQLGQLLARLNIHPPYKSPYGPRGRRWIRTVSMNVSSSIIREELLERLAYLDNAITQMDLKLEAMASNFPQVKALTDLYGIGLFSALLIIAEIGEPNRFRQARQVAAYAGLTPTVRQSGQHDYRGAISKEGSTWMRWILVEAAMRIIRKDQPLQAFYKRVSRKAGKKRARVAVARKLAEICWKRLRNWEREKHAA